MCHFSRDNPNCVYTCVPGLFIYQGSTSALVYTRNFLFVPFSSSVRESFKLLFYFAALLHPCLSRHRPGKVGRARPGGGLVVPRPRDPPPYEGARVAPNPFGGGKLGTCICCQPRWHLPAWWYVTRVRCVTTRYPSGLRAGGSCPPIPYPLA